MSFLTIGYKCNCSTNEARLGVVDGDRGTVHCGTCEGTLGSIEDFYGTTIRVKQPYSFPEAITVQVKDEDGEVIECNHAGAEAEALEFTVHSSYDGGAYTAPDDSRSETVQVCDKCKAWYDEVNNEWKED